MGFNQDLSSNSISVTVDISDKKLENAADVVVKTFGAYGNRQSIKMGSRVRIRHVEMSADKFNEFAQLQRDFPSFRLTRYRALRSRGILGTICGHTIIEREGLDSTIIFQYKEVQEHDDSGLVGPSHIHPPRSYNHSFLLDF